MDTWGKSILGREQAGKDLKQKHAWQVCGMSKGKAGEASQILWGPGGHGQGVGSSRGKRRSYWRVWS